MQPPLRLKEKRRCRNGTSRSCRRCCLVAVVEGCQEAQKNKAEKKRRQTEDSGERRIRNEIAQARRRQARLMMPRRLHKEQMGEVLSRSGTARKLKNEEEEEEEDWQKENQMEVQ